LKSQEEVRNMLALKKKKFFGIIIGSMVLGMVLAIGLSALFFWRQDTVLLSQSKYDAMTEMAGKYEKTEQLSQLIQQNYYLPVEEGNLMEGVYRGLFQGLKDPYSEYLTAEEYEELMIHTLGEFEGIGVTITADENGNIIVVSTIEGTPADLAGLKTGDIITMVDGDPYTGMELSKAAQAMRGEKGTQVTITYWRAGVMKEETLTRATIIGQSIYSKILENDIGYLRITQFEKNTAVDFEREFRGLQSRDVQGIVIDIRNNGGGIMDSGIAIADMLIGQGTITYLENQKGERTYYNSDSSMVDIPYVLLVNEGTASTSEILAAAVKDNEGGQLVGSRTFGKGVVQSVEQLPDGDAMKLTILQYFSPDGDVIHGKGIQPDISMEDQEETPNDEVLEKALSLF
jgi:carboxyl-terminal processing protease